MEINTCIKNENLFNISAVGNLTTYGDAGNKINRDELCVIAEINVTFVCLCIASKIANDDQQDTTILVYLFIPNQLYMFRAIS